MNRLTISLLILCIAMVSFGQNTEKWDLKKCVEYALQNNLTVKQADLQIKFAEVDKQQAQWSQFPSFNFSTSTGYSSGRNQDPTSFSLITTGYVFSNYSLQSSVDLFNWFTKKNEVVVRDLNLQATKEGFEKAKNDIALNVAVGYLQALLANEQANLARIKVEESKAQLDAIQKQVNAGKLPELNAAQQESVLAIDSSNLVAAETAKNQFVLQLKTLLNLDPALPFDVETPPVDKIPVESIGDLQPDAVYQLAMTNQPQQKVDELNLKAAKKSVEVARGAMYPTVSMFGSLGAAYNNKSRQVVSKSQINPAIGKVNISGTDYNVFPLSPYDIYTYGNIPYFDQLNQNFRQSIGIGISVPILNGGSLRFAWQRSKLTLKQTELKKEVNSTTLKQDIYKAYYDAVAALEKFNANQKAVETAQRAYDYAVKRYNVGLLSTFDLNTTQNNLFSAKSNLVYAQYDYVFKVKLLEFYKGQGLKL